MKNRKIWNAALVLLPVGAVTLESLPNTVQVFKVGEAVTGYSYFELLPMETMWYFPIAALILSFATIALALIYVFAKKPVWLKLLTGVSFGAVCAVTLPVIIQSEIRVIPNVVPALLLGAQCLMAYWMVRQSNEASEPKKKAPRLKAR